MVPLDSSVFHWCVGGELDKLQSAFGCGQVSPNVISESSLMGLLHVATLTQRPAIVRLLLDLGVDKDQEDRFGHKAIGFAVDRPIDPSEIPNTLALIELLDPELESATEGNRWNLMCTVKFLSRHDQGRLRRFLRKLDLLDMRADILLLLEDLTMLLGRGHLIFATTIEILLCRFVDLSSQGIQTEWSLQETTLDLLDIFLRSSTEWNPIRTIEARDLLVIFQKAGIDMDQFLQEAHDRYAAYKFFLHPIGQLLQEEWAEITPRRLSFKKGDCPNIRCKIYIDPASGAGLVRSEFACMNLDHTLFGKIDKEGHHGVANSWKDVGAQTWPFVYPWWIPPLARCTCCTAPDLSRNAAWPGWPRLLANHKARTRRILVKKYGYKSDGSLAIPGSWIDENDSDEAEFMR